MVSLFILAHVDKIGGLLYFYRDIPIAIMNIGPDMFPIVNPDRMLTLHRAREFSNKQDSWSELKKSIYIATMVHLAGMGYEDSYSLFPKTFQSFSDFMTRFFRYCSLRPTSFIHGGMNYDEAHSIIINYPEFQAIES
jgi:hypothetical protein